MTKKKSGSAFTPIGQAHPQEWAAVSGVIRSSTAMALRGCPACRCTITDGTGELDLIFLGRVEVPGLEAGRHCSAEGMAACRDDRIVIWNPRYSLAQPVNGNGASQATHVAPSLR
jgi:hypothetical protein